MARHRTHSIAFKRQVVQEYLAGETLHGLTRRHDLSRALIRICVEKYEVRVAARVDRTSARSTDHRPPTWTLQGGLSPDAGHNPVLHPRLILCPLLGAVFLGTVRLVLKLTNGEQGGVDPVSWTVMDLGERGVAGSVRS